MRLLTVVTLLVALAMACSPAATGTPAPTITPEPTYTPLPTATPRPTATPTPVPTAIAQQAPQVTRTIDFSGVRSGQTLIVTITPSGFTGFYAVKEQLGELELVAHTADNYEEGTFIMLGPQTFTYEVRVPQAGPRVGALRAAAFAIKGQWWTDPGDKRGVTSAETRLPVTQPAAKPLPTTAMAIPPTTTPVRRPKASS